MSFDPNNAVLDETPINQVKVSKFNPENAVLDEEPKVGGILGKVPLSKYQQGERNILGMVQERPGAVSREAIRTNPTLALTGPFAGIVALSGIAGEEAKQAAQGQSINPTSQTFQNQALDAYYKKFGVNPLSVIGGFGVSTAGLVADAWANPADAAATLIPFSKPAQTVSKTIGATKAGQALSKAANYPLERIPGILARDVTAKLSSNRGGLEAVSAMGKRSPETIVSQADKEIELAVKRGITKGIRPSVGGKQTAARNQEYFSRVRQGVEMIVDNKDGLQFSDDAGNMVSRLPQSVADYASAIEQTKRPIFQAYTQMAEEAGNAGAMFNASPVINKLTSVSKDVKYNPQIRKYATELINEVGELNGQSPLTIQERIKDLNQSLVGYYAGRVDKAKARLDASVANILREELDNMIEKTQGPGYQNLKNAYGALKAAEKEVNHRAVVLSRANSKNIFDLTDIFTGGELISGALTGNPAQMAKGGFGYALKELYKRWVSPDAVVKKMFADVDRLRSGASAARSSIPQALTAEVVDSIPVSAQRALPGASEQLQIGYGGARGLPGTGDIYGDGFSATSKRTIPTYMRPYFSVGQMPVSNPLAKPLQIVFKPTTENLGAMVRPSNTAGSLQRVNEQIVATLRVIPNLQRRGMINEVAETRRYLKQLLDEQAVLFAEADKSRQLRSSVDIALDR
jgi:hypothetical protein